MLRALLLPLSLAVAFAACQSEPEPEVDVLPPPSQDAQENLLGMWAVADEGGEVSVPTARYQFGPTGRLTVTAPDGTQESTYSYPTPGEILIGNVLYGFELDGDAAILRARDGDEEIRLRKVADTELEDVPPPRAGATGTTAADTVTAQ